MENQTEREREHVCTSFRIRMLEVEGTLDTFTKDTVGKVGALTKGCGQGEAGARGLSEPSSI